MSDLIERLRNLAEYRYCDRYLGDNAADEIERLRNALGRSVEMTGELLAKLDAQQAMIDTAPRAFMDTRTALGVCALKEEDFPALYALQGHRVALLVLE